MGTCILNFVLPTTPLTGSKSFPSTTSNSYFGLGLSRLLRYAANSSTVAVGGNWPTTCSIICDTTCVQRSECFGIGCPPASYRRGSSEASACIRRDLSRARGGSEAGLSVSFCTTLHYLIRRKGRTEACLPCIAIRQQHT